ncbi:type II toxin-antitoxin system YafO family toxin [Hahella sp. KA22]|nr:type II toxin-antitoxin system YafO family toxin [Hahella sp. KA22]QAY58291.1 type II toxin-antitoxin system YafO family toxin [Hahella sp. KA22]
MAEVFMHELLQNRLTIQQQEKLESEFRRYKEEDGYVPGDFGRDAPYTRTFNRRYLELMHLHIRRDNKAWPNRTLQFYRRSGFVLVYCYGFIDRNKYLLIDIIKHFDPKKPNEKENTDEDNNLMAELEAIAESFRDKN